MPKTRRGPRTSAGVCGSALRAPSEADAVHEPEAAAHLRREVLYVGEVVAVELVADVVGPHGNGMHGVTSR